MPELDQQDWTPYRVGPKSKRSNWTETSCQPLTRVMHVTHVRHALSILDDARIRRRPVYDKSRLNTTRIHVSWLSPNDWGGAGGSRYGGVEFGFEWKAIIAGKQAYWIGAYDYEPRACRILLTTEDYTKNNYKPYDPTLGDGPWWHDTTTGEHFWNGTYCLEIMYEGDVPLAGADGMAFTKHHAFRCNLDKNAACRDANHESHQASEELIAGWAVGLYAGRPFPATCRAGIVGAWNDLIGPLGNVEEWGDCGVDNPLAPVLGRALLSATARRDEEGWASIAKRFRSREDAARTLARIVATTFGVNENDLRIPRDVPEAEIKYALDEAAEKALAEEPAK